jgi:TonB family protein
MLHRITVLLALSSVLIAAAALVGEDASVGNRKIINLVKPTYPQIARTMRIGGTVKMEATVGRDGKPSRIEVKGGHPALIKAAVDAVRGFRWTVGQRETEEPIEMLFSPNQ